jgi:hypothetical protein
MAYRYCRPNAQDVKVIGHCEVAVWPQPRGMLYHHLMRLVRFHLVGTGGPRIVFWALESKQPHTAVIFWKHIFLKKVDDVFKKRMARQN